MKSLSLSQPHLLIMVGIPGSGKSFFAKRFAATFNVPYLDYDLLLDFTGRNSDVSDAFAGYLLKELFKTHHTVIFDGPTSTREERDALRDLARSSGYTCLFIWTQTDVETAQARYIKERSREGRKISRAHYDSLLHVFVPPIGKDHSTVVISGKHTYATQAKAVLKNLAAAKQIIRATIVPKREGVSIPIHRRSPHS